MTTSIRDTDFCRFVDFVEEINKDNSRTYKMEVLKKYKDDELIKYYLDFVFNPYVTVGISSKKIAQAEEDIASMIFRDESTNIPALFEYLKEHNTGRREDAIRVAKVRLRWIPRYYDLLVSVVTKKQRAEIWDNRDTYLGVTATVQYFEETTNADGGVSLRFPVFIDMRYDK